MDKRFWGFLVVIAIIFVGIFFVSQSNKAAAPSDTKGTLTNHVTGSTTSGVKLVEYGDFQCPACGAYEPIVEQVRAKYADRIQFQFRNFPLFQIHTNALAAARVAEAADLQGKYWEMHDSLYKNQSDWSTQTDPMSSFVIYANNLGLNVTKFKADAKASVTNDRVQADLAEGNKLGVNSTPTFFLNGKKVSNPDPTLEGFSKIIDAEIAKKAGSTTATPTPVPTPAPAQ